MSEPKPNPQETATEQSEQQQPAAGKVYRGEAVPSAAAPAPATAHGSGKGLATGALILSLLALGSSGFLFVQGQNTFKNQELRVSQELEKAALGDSQNGMLLQNSLKRQEELAAAIEAAQQTQQGSTRELENVNRAYAELLKGRVNWLVDEVEVTLNLASQQLVLSGNVPVAVSVLESIDQRLSRFDQPELLPIKQAVSRDLTALKTRPYLNVAGTALLLDRLESAVAGLPLLLDNTLQAEPEAPESVAQAGGFWARMWDSTGSMLKNMVEVRKLESSDAMLLAPEQIYFIRENLRLRLLDARIALLQHQGDVYQNDLAAAEATVKQYFDTASPNTEAWLKDIAELKALDIRMVSDDILNGSQTAVRNYQNSIRTALPVSLPETKPAAAASQTAAPTAASVPAAPSAVQAASAPKAASVPAPKPASAAAPKAKADTPPPAQASTPSARPAGAAQGGKP